MSNDDRERLRSEIDDFLRSNNISLPDDRMQRLQSALDKYRSAQNKLKMHEEILKKEIIRYMVELWKESD